jgi:uncharacterized protein
MHPLSRIASFFAPRSYAGPVAQFLEILMLQATPFCNIDCDYCYLPSRNTNKRMNLETITASVGMVIDAGLVDKRLSIVWHAGEPLVLPTTYYAKAFEAIEKVVDGRFEISHCFQSNGCLIDDTWCEFTKKRSARMGLSIDGPAFLHDLHRKTRGGRTTHAQTMRGVQKLKEYGIPFHAIAVITADALDHADAIFHFFEGLGVTEVGFNIEELEGVHRSSSLDTQTTSDQVYKFWHRLYELHQATGGMLQIREFRKAAAAILLSQEHLPWEEIALQNDQALPFRIISVDYQGHVSTFSPELLGAGAKDYNDFIFGEVGRHELAAMRTSEAFRKVSKAVMRGVKECSKTCEYFTVCGGGAPSNKYFENGDLTSTVTMYCKTAIQIPIQIVLKGFEDKLNCRFQSDPEGGSGLDTGGCNGSVRLA